MLDTSKNKINIWQELANETNGTFKEGYSWRSDSNTINYKNWTIISDNYRLWSGKSSMQMTRVITPITLTDNFKFEIYREGFVRKVEKFFGAQDIEIGYPDFDKAFTIKSNNELKIKTLLRNKEIRNLISSQTDVNIQISNYQGIWEKELPKNEFELSYFIDGVIKDIEILKSLIELFKLILDGLYEMNTIDQMKIQ
ncbi:hypothetical protein C8C83_0290 [Flavobacterium sp. 90]|uniref:hypothetical protein n=1 Tax=unclassified Flavobacterium TaxID=196869 RepID=UPI000EAC6115|nr:MULTISPECIES: hypothetical protein [unclassified Flavobacterium]RKR08707.1 hypothetical protein C8C82_0585 [Flavobacterium sp. 81]TCK52494.1 hypothetical protein C8C83_0290 [Flavobacterium sp. 90]